MRVMSLLRVFTVATMGFSLLFLGATQSRIQAEGDWYQCAFYVEVSYTGDNMIPPGGNEPTEITFDPVPWIVAYGWNASNYLDADGYTVMTGGQDPSDNLVTVDVGNADNDAVSQNYVGYELVQYMANDPAACTEGTVR
jgi:hypothetical protein